MYVDQTNDVHHGLGELPNEELLVLSLLNGVARAAEAHGSVLQRLVGNHELAQQSSSHSELYSRLYASPLAVGLTAEQSEEVKTLTKVLPTAWQDLVSPRIIAKYRERTESFQTGQFHTLIGECAPKVVAVVGSHLFVHGGINLRMIEYANRHGRNLVEWANELFDLTWNSDSMTAEQQDAFSELVFGDEGMAWDRQLAEPGKLENDACSLLAAQVLEALNGNLSTYGERLQQPVEHLVVAHCQQFNQYMHANSVEHVGHRPQHVSVKAYETVYSTKPTVDSTPQELKVSHEFFSGINSLCDNSVWRVDVGMSRGFARRLDGLTASHKKSFVQATTPQILEIEGDAVGSGELVYKVHAHNQPLPGVKRLAGLL
jgi:hypothetical protein